jgi:hypothetical protein
MMESIEDQWTPPASTEILSTSWPTITDAKKAVKIWVANPGPPLLKIIRLDFNFTASFLPVPEVIHRYLKSPPTKSLQSSTGAFLSQDLEAFV